MLSQWHRDCLKASILTFISTSCVFNCCRWALASSFPPPILHCLTFGGNSVCSGAHLRIRTQCIWWKAWPRDRTTSIWPTHNKQTVTSNHNRLGWSNRRSIFWNECGVAEERDFPLSSQSNISLARITCLEQIGRTKGVTCQPVPRHAGNSIY